jgi:thiamine-phosphate pyrophosphorylase
MILRRAIAGLYVIADTRCLSGERLNGAVGHALAGGARIVQYRDKGGDHARRLDQATYLSKLCADFDALFIVNDDVELAARINAGGVHLGRKDSSPASARRLLGGQAVIGVSCYNEFDRALTAISQDVDYVAFGSFFPSRTKPLAVRADKDLLQRSKRELNVSVVAIGGITPDNGVSLIAAGADCLAVMDGVFGQEHIRAAAQRYALLFGPLARQRQNGNLK